MGPQETEQLLLESFSSYRVALPCLEEGEVWEQWREREMWVGYIMWEKINKYLKKKESKCTAGLASHKMANPEILRVDRDLDFTVLFYSIF